MKLLEHNVVRELCEDEINKAIVADHYNDKEAELMSEKITVVLKKGFKLIPTKKRVKMLEEQRKRIEGSEKCFKTDRKQLEKTVYIIGDLK